MPDLGKYAVWVLSAYGVSLALILALVALSWRQSVRARAALEARDMARENGRNGPGQARAAHREPKEASRHG